MNTEERLREAWEREERSRFYANAAYGSMTLIRNTMCPLSGDFIRLRVVCRHLLRQDDSQETIDKIISKCRYLIQYAMDGQVSVDNEHHIIMLKNCTVNVNDLCLLSLEPDVVEFGVNYEVKRPWASAGTIRFEEDKTGEIARFGNEYIQLWVGSRISWTDHSTSQSADWTIKVALRGVKGE